MSDTATEPRDRLAEAKRLLLEKRLRGEAKGRALHEPIGRSGLPGPAYPMSYQQEQLWFLDQLQPGSSYYNIPGASLISARVHVPTLERALTEVVRRHESIRTAFRLVDGKPMQVVQPPYAIFIPVVEMRGPNGEPAPDVAVRRKASEVGAMPFDLQAGPLFRAALFRVSDDDFLLVFNIHHIVTDGWAMPIVTREMEEIYAAYARGEPSPLRDPEIQYADYSVWQRGHLSGPTLQKLVDYWKGHLGGAPTALELPYDRPRPPVSTNRGTMHRFVYPGGLTGRLRALGRQEGATVNMVFMAGFNLLLQRYSGQDDLVVGTLLGNRNRAELEPLVGYFVNSGAIRTRLDGDPTFREVVRRVRTAILDADAHQELPFDMVVDALKVLRDAGRNPVFQVMYFHHTFVESHHLDDDQGLTGVLNTRSLYQEAEAVLVDTGASKFDLSVATLESEGRMPGMVEYATDLFDHATIVRMVAHLGALLEEGCAHPDVPVSRLEMTTEEERRTLLAWGTNERPYPRGESLASLFARQAAATPGAVAVEFEDATLTYRELDERSNRIARHLASLGVGAGDCVGVATESSARTVAALLAIAKAGAAAVPLEPAYPAERLAFMVQDTRARVILAGGGRLEWLGEGGSVAVVGLDEAWETIARHSAEPFTSPAGPGSVATIFYTSGSTGTPKGVRVHHRGMVRTVAGVAYAPLCAGERVAQQNTLAFDASFGEIWGALLNGATLVGIPRDVLLSPAGYARTVREKRIGVAFITTQLFNQLVREAPDALGSLRAVLVGGEKADPDAMRLCLRGTPPAALLHMYGPTEASLFTTCHRVTHLADDAASVPIGRPVDNARVYVLAPGGTLAGVGVPGELCAGGDGVAAGYLDRPALTAERFVADPFVPGATMYRTGDRVRWTPDGVIEFIGRVDDQVKVRGYRIELGEVESVLRRHPALRDAAVAAREDGADRKLVGYLVLKDGAAPNAAELRAWMKERLPDYMAPSVFVTLDALPLMPSGKVDRRRLPSPEGRRVEAGGGYVAPRGEAEATLARIWSEVLRVERVGVHDNFFALGGDSIVSIQIVARANEAGLRVQPRHVFMYQTVAELAAMAGQAAAPVAEQGAVTGPVPLTPVQRWFLGQALPDPHHFNLTLLFEAGERIDADALAGACAAVVAHHDALRLRYARGADGWAQVNAAPSDDAALEAVDLSAVAADGREAAFTARAAELQRSLDLAGGPLIRFALFDLGGDAPQRLLIVAHHLVMDAVSWSFVAQDVETAYRQAARGEAIGLPAKTTSFREWAARLAEYADSGELRRQAPFWLRQGGASPLPVDGGGPNAEGDAGRLFVELDEETTRALLQDVPPVYGTQVNDVLLAALARAFRGWTGEAALLVDLEAHGREALFNGVDLSRTAGWFTAIYPVRVELTDDGAPGEDLKAVKEQLRAVPEKGIGYGLLRWLSHDPEIPHALAALPRPQVSFNYLGRMDFGGSGEGGLFAGADADVGPARGPLGERTHLLAVDAAVSGGRLFATWTYGRSVHHAETVERLAAAFADELRALVAHCRDPHAGGFTPSDFDLAGLDQGGLDALLSQIG
ncbi:MAG TPA: amino acid adenylation domain-containing protein [Longimicrobium sp.]|nr:amino acid adenylation domain-containing protein [Longimicrobium sp.]